MLKKLLIAAAGLLISAPVLADQGLGRYRHHAKHHHFKHHQHYRVVPPRVVFYPPAPAYYYAPPSRVYYAPPAPVFYAPSGISVRLNFPL